MEDQRQDRPCIQSKFMLDPERNLIIPERNLIKVNVD
jgi:hypothetical protein